MPFKKIGIFIVTALFVSIPFTTTITANEINNNSGLSFQKDPSTNNVRMLRSKAGTIPFKKEAGESTADLVKQQFAPYFSIKNPATDLIIKKEFFPSVNRHNIRYQQQHKGIPVIGGELVANLDSQQLTSMSGETSQVQISNIVPKISAEQAQTTAINAVSKWYEIEPTHLTASKPDLSIYDPSLIGPSTGQHRLVWQLDVTPTELAPVNEYVLVDAERNVIVLHFNQIHTVLDRETYTANNLEVLPGTLVCDETDPTCAAGGTDAQNAHRYAADTYNFYLNNHGRDSLDGNGMTIVSTVEYGNVGNAFWAGDPYNQIAYGPGFSVADDVVAHELTHGVTTNTSNLFYYYQSGAINESLSDVWGEFVDLTNNGGTDNANVRWQLGEDIPGLGAIRNMANPALFGDPDRMTSAFYATGTADLGGVHTNSGVNNKAVTLMVDGGSFNGQTVSAIGLSKTATLYYDVQTNYLVSGSDYLDLYNALNQSCQNLIGTNGITGNDCTEVNQALLAVEMNQQPVADFNPDAEVCPAGSAITTSLFYDDFESSLVNWSNTNLIGTTSWAVLRDYATSGIRAAFAPGADALIDSVLSQNTPISIPAASTYHLHFNHIFEFESSGANNFDGGVIEYSINNGTSWNDAGSLIDSGRTYNGTLNGTTNPLMGQDAFTSFSHGYNSTRINLSTLAGQNVRFRFRNTADSSVESGGWGIDDVRIYSCTTNDPPIANAGNDQDVNANTSVTLNGSGSSDPDGDAISYLWTQTAGANVNLSGATTTMPTFTSPGVMSTLVFQLRVTDTLGQFTNDTVTVTVNGPPNANAGGNQTINVDSAVTLNGSGSSDPEGGALIYNWMQMTGTTVAMSATNIASPSFTAPSADSTLTFQLTVMDNRGQTDMDTVTITVQTPAPQPPQPAQPPTDSGSGCTVSENGRFDPIWLLLLMFFAGLHLVNRRRTQQKVTN